jgi:hypothetical protein
MAKDAQKTTVSITPGQNEPVNNVLKFEDLVAHAKQGAAKLARSRGAAKHRDRLDDVQRLAADLDKTLRALRAAAPDQPVVSRARRTRARKRKA